VVHVIQHSRELKNNENDQHLLKTSTGHIWQLITIRYFNNLTTMNDLWVVLTISGTSTVWWLHNHINLPLKQNFNMLKNVCLCSA